MSVIVSVRAPRMSSVAGSLPARPGPPTDSRCGRRTSGRRGEAPGRARGTDPPPGRPPARQRLRHAAPAARHTAATNCRIVTRVVLSMVSHASIAAWTSGRHRVESRTHAAARSRREGGRRHRVWRGPVAQMADAKPPTVLDLTWDGRLMFTARESGHEWVLDGRNEAGPSPVAALASALAGCMAIDMVHILTKGRFEVRSFSAQLTGRRADTEPRRFVAFDLQLHARHQRPGRPGRPGDRALAREVLLRVALVAPGHRVDHERVPPGAGRGPDRGPVA